MRVESLSPLFEERLFSEPSVLSKHVDGPFHSLSQIVSRRDQFLSDAPGPLPLPSSEKAVIPTGHTRNVPVWLFFFFPPPN